MQPYHGQAQVETRQIYSNERTPCGDVVSQYSSLRHMQARVKSIPRTAKYEGVVDARSIQHPLSTNLYKHHVRLLEEGINKLKRKTLCYFTIIINSYRGMREKQGNQARYKYRA